MSARKEVGGEGNGTQDGYGNPCVDFTTLFGALARNRVGMAKLRGSYYGEGRWWHAKGSRGSVVYVVLIAHIAASVNLTNRA